MALYSGYAKPKGKSYTFAGLGRSLQNAYQQNAAVRNPGGMSPLASSTPVKTALLSADPVAGAGAGYYDDMGNYSTTNPYPSSGYGSGPVMPGGAPAPITGGQAPYAPPPVITPPTQPPSSGYYQPPASYYTGGQGGAPILKQDPYSSSNYYGATPPSYSLQPGSPAFGAVQGANSRMEASAAAALAALQRDVLGSTFGQSVLNKFENPQGMSPEEIAARNRQAAAANAQAYGNAIERSRQRSAATGGLDDAGQLFLESQIRGNAARDMQSGYDAITMENARLKQAQQAQYAAMEAQLLGLQQNYDQGYAQAQLGRQFPVIPGVTQGAAPSTPGVAPGYQFLNAQGQIIRTPMTPWEQGQAQKERIQYEMSQGRVMPAYY